MISLVSAMLGVLAVDPPRQCFARNSGHHVIEDHHIEGPALMPGALDLPDGGKTRASIARHSMLRASSCRVSTRWFMSISSTTSARRPFRVCGSARRLTVGELAGFSGTSNQNLLPRPEFAFDAQLALHQLDDLLGDRQAEPRPRQKRRVIELSAWVNFWNRRPRTSSDMPTPLSVISNRTRGCRSSSCRSATSLETPPLSVNLMPLLTRLSNTCRSRVGSPLNPVRAEGSTKTASSIPFSSALGPGAG